MSDLGKFLGGFVIGGMVGGLFGVLLAPRAGSETRQMIAEGTSDSYKKAEASVQDIQKRTDLAIDELQKTGQEIMQKISDTFAKVKEQGDKAASDVTTNVQS